MAQMNQPQSYGAEEEQETYKQELGLKKMLYKYEHENEQLKAQIKALTERLADIIVKKQQPLQQYVKENPNEYRLTVLKQEMKALFSQIEKINREIKCNREEINQFQELRCVELTNQIKKEDKEIDSFKKEIDRFNKLKGMKNFKVQAIGLEQSSLRINSGADRFKQLQLQLQNTRKHIRQLERGRDQHDRSELKRHSYVVNLNSKARKYEHMGKEHPMPVEETRKEKGIWHMQYTQENYKKIEEELQILKGQKERIIGSLKNENMILKSRFAQLSQDAEQFNKSIHLPQIEMPRSIKKVQLDQSININLSSLNSSRVNSPPKLLAVGPKQFQRSNDKNYQPKNLRKIEWESANFRTNGIQWNDAHLRSPISGINFWFDGSLIGIQFLHRMGESSQHLHLVNKAISPVQYRLGTNDYVTGAVLWISQNKISGIELRSKNGRQDAFGARGKGRKFDYLMKEGQKPVFSYGRFRIANNLSQITKLGFEVI